MKRIALFLFAGVLGLAVLQPAAAQNSQNQKHKVNIEVQKINDIVAPGDVTIDIDPSNGNFTGTTTTSNGYDVTSNDKNGRIVSVNVSNNNNLGEVESLKILSSGTEAPGEANVSSDLELVEGGTEISNATDLTSSFTGVDVDGIPVQFEATVSPDFNPTQNSTSITVKYTLTTP